MDFNFTGGLYVNRNSFMEIPPNTTEVCHNAFLSRDGILQKRRGFYLTYQATTETVYSLAQYSNRVLAVIDDELVLMDEALEAVVPYSSIYTVASDSVFAVANNNLYIASLDNNVLKLDGLTGTIKSAGVERSLDITAILTGVTGVHPADSQANYRILFGYTDNNNNKILSSPSNLATVVNPAIQATATESSLVITVTSNAHGLATGNNVTITNAYSATNADVANVTGDYTITVTDANTFQFTLLATPIGTLARLEYNTKKVATVTANLNEDVEEGWFCQIFRSSYSLSASVPALEDLQLVDEVTLTASDVAARLFTYDDEIPENLRRGFLYTNPSQEGIVNSNTPPPSCKHLVTHKNCLFFGNVKEKARKNVTLVTVTLMAIDDTISITTVTDGVPTTLVYTAKEAEDIATRQFRLRTDSSVSVNIDTTARSICNVINRDTDSKIVAYYSSGTNDLAGQFVLEIKDFTSESFYVNTSSPLSFSPAIPETGDAYSATNQVESNKVMFSKLSEPEAVPLGNFLQVGNKDEKILAMLSLKDSLICLTDVAVYRIGGEVPSEFFVRTIDTNTKCIAEGSVAVLNEAVVFLSDKGIVAANDNNVQLLSENISALILNSLERDGVDSSYGYSYPSENMYFISTLKENSISINDRIVYAYSAKTGAWSTVDTICLSSVYHKDKMILLAQDRKSIFRERKNRNLTDFVDYSRETFTVTDQLSDNVVRGEYTGGSGLGLRAIRSGSDFAVILNATQVSATLYDLELNYMPHLLEEDEVTFKAFEVDIAIPTKVISSPIFSSGEENGLEVTKYYHEAQFRFRNNAACSELKTRFLGSETVGVTNTLRNIDAGQYAGWGLEAWGLGAWGSSAIIDRDYYTGESKPLRTYIDAQISRGNYLQIEFSHDRAEPLDLQTVSVIANVTKGRRISR